jgi:SAM-dependent methyltransferase
MTNPWLEIPLADYESHMSLPAIGQARWLADQLELQLRKYAPGSVAVVGCAGGNGFDRVARAGTRRLVGIDINPSYIEQAFRRYSRAIPGLELYVADIQEPLLSVAPVDLIYAALLFEHVELARTIETLRRMCKPGGVLAVVLQLPSGSKSVSPSRFASIQALDRTMRLVAPEKLTVQAGISGFAPVSSETIALPSGKEFAVLEFRSAGKLCNNIRNVGPPTPG